MNKVLTVCAVICATAGIWSGRAMADAVVVEVESGVSRSLTADEISAVSAAGALEKAGAGTLKAGTDFKDNNLNPDIDIKQGHFQIDGGASRPNEGDVKTVTVRSGAEILLQNADWTGSKRALVMEDWSYFKSTYSEYPHVDEGEDKSTWKNVWEGTTVLNGVASGYLTAHTPWTFWRSVSGVGGFKVSGGGWLGLESSNNSFQGGVEVEGVMSAEGNPVGGVVVRRSGAIPASGGALKLKNANLQLLADAEEAELPSFVCYSNVNVQASNVYSRAAVQSLVKYNDGVLNIPMRLQVHGNTVINEGTLRFAEHAGVAGLKWWHYTADAVSTYDSTTPQGDYQGIDVHGASWAYQSWPYVEGNNDGYYYTGYINVPGEEGEDVTFNVISTIGRICRIDIGGETLVKFWDGWDGTSGDWSEYYKEGEHISLVVSRQVTLKAGWQPIYIMMANRESDWPRGPQWYGGEGGYGWDITNFGIGIDWEGRCEVNPGNYVKLLDDGTGSFLRAEIGEAEANYGYLTRPDFNGTVTFAPGTTLDLNDNAPYVPFWIDKLVGAPRVENGEMRINGTWTIRPNDFLTVASGAKLAFVPGTTVVFAGDFADMPKKDAYRRIPLLRVEEGGEVENMDAVCGRLGSSHWHILKSRDGKGLDLFDNNFMKIVLR